MLVFTHIVENAFERCNEDTDLNIDPFDQLDNNKVEQEIGNEEEGVDLENDLQ